MQPIHCAYSRLQAALMLLLGASALDAFIDLSQFVLPLALAVIGLGGVRWASKRWRTQTVPMR